MATWPPCGTNARLWHSLGGRHNGTAIFRRRRVRLGAWHRLRAGRLNQQPRADARNRVEAAVTAGSTSSDTANIYVELVETEATSRGIERLAEIEGREIKAERKCHRSGSPANRGRRDRMPSNPSCAPPTALRTGERRPISTDQPPQAPERLPQATEPIGQTCASRH